MGLYIEPPTGRISWQKLEAFAQKRLDFLMKVTEARGDLCRLHELVCEEATVADSECLIVGSVKDKVSHFTLRLLLGGDPETWTFFCEAETALFDCHFSCMSEEEMNKFFHKLDKRLRIGSTQGSGFLTPASFKNRDITSIFGVFSNIRLSVGSWKKVTGLYLAQCSTSHFFVPFQSVFHLLGKRQVTLEQGMARVPFSKLREVVREQFLSLMQLATGQASQQLPAALADDRLNILWRKLKHRYRRRHPYSHGEGVVPGLSLEQVDTMATQYPLCMSSLLQSLRKKHRLSHHARIQLTLFLKDLGLPVHQAIALWRHEYSQPCGAGSHCNHSWQEDSRRYTYNIRHLYGLEGARRNYHGHCCESLQQRVLGCSEEGGCPFSHWDDAALSRELSRLGLQVPDITDILFLQRSGRFSAACQRCLHSTRLSRAHVTESADAQNMRVQSECKMELPSCHTVHISSSPETLYRTDCCRSEELGACSEVKVVENEVERVRSCDDKLRMPTSGGETGPRMVMETPETTMSVTLCEKRTRKRQSQAVSELDVCACKTSHFGESETLVHNLSTVQAVVSASSLKCSHTLPYPKCRKTMPDEILAYPRNVEPAEHELVHTAMSVQDQLAVKSEGQAKSKESCLRCFDHDVCPSQGACGQSSSTKTSPSVDILKPVQYFQWSYQRLLESLKS